MQRGVARFPLKFQFLQAATYVHLHDAMAGSLFMHYSSSTTAVVLWYCTADQYLACVQQKTFLFVLLKILILILIFIC